MLKRFLAWLLRRAGLYLLLLIAVAFATFVLPHITHELNGARMAERRFKDLSAISERLHREKQNAQAEFERSLAEMQDKSAAELDARLAEVRGERNSLAAQRSQRGLLAQYMTGGREAVIQNQSRELQFLLLSRQIDSLDAAKHFASVNPAQRSLAVGDLKDRAAAQSSACNTASKARQDYESRWQWRLERYFPSSHHRELKDLEGRICTEARLAASTYQAAAAFAKTRASLMGDAQALESELQLELRRSRVEWQGTWRERARIWAREWQVEQLLWQAAILFMAILATPYLIRLVFYFVLAPVAERRPSIRLRVPGESSPVIPVAARSSISLGLQLGKDEELLTRQGYLQTSAQGGEKTTQWMLDWRHPLSILAAGLVFLTRIRGDGLQVTISAVHDPFAEVAQLDLPMGSACVIHPRAIAAVVQPTGQPVRVSSNWRLFSLNAWLTMQLRYLVFHGPAILVIKGGRGVRIEDAEQGRIFAQDQLVGFSADLAYSVARTETFWPYFLGREQLFKDKVESGTGILIVEEAPLAGGKYGGARHGLEGAMDAMLKAIGL